MSKFEFKLPDIGEGVSEGEIVNWLVKEGDSVQQDQDMVEVMTDKATVTIGAPKAGVVAERKSRVGDVVPVGSVLLVLDLDGNGAAAASAPEPATTPEKSEESAQGPVASAVGDIKEELPGMPSRDKVSSREKEPAPARDAAPGEKPLAAPATRKLARELGIDLGNVEPSGPGGRITREDVERHQADGARPREKAPEIRPVPSAQGDERVPVRGLRKRIFDNMARSKHTAAHFSYVEECHTDALTALRERLKPIAEKEGAKLTYLPFLVKACVVALKKHRALNCLIDDAAQELIYKSHYDLGIAIATDAGLIVPVLRQADRLSILEIAREIARLAEAARQGKVQREDLGGSSFTITSLGRLGGLMAPPIINYPEVGIMGVHQMKKRPIVKDDQIVIGEVMLLSFSFDHRVIDGHVGAAFAQEIIRCLEDPDQLLLEMP